jgi:hypothetical protein
MTVFDRLGFNFDTTRFGSGNNLTPAAANSISRLSNVGTPMPDWQKSDLATSSVTKTNYFQNPTTTYVNSMLSSAISISSNALIINAFSMSASANNLIIELNRFVSHTDNISGITTVTSPSVPSFDRASNLGRMSLQILSKADEPQSNTDVLLGSFTSLFIQDILLANSNQLLSYSIQLKNSISANTTDDGEGGPSTTTYSSNLANSIISSMSSYCNTTSSILNTRRIHDWTFYQNTNELMRENGFLQQFNNLGNTQKFLIKNAIGTTSLIDKLTSANTI